MKEALQVIANILEDNPIVAIIITALICGTLIQVTSIIFLGKVISLSSLNLF